jgi:hypothetical protein
VSNIARENFNSIYNPHSAEVRPKHTYEEEYDYPDCILREAAK